jgi:hypothetical protein
MSTRKILIVDDNPNMSTLLSRRTARKPLKDCGKKNTIWCLQI